MSGRETSGKRPGMKNICFAGMDYIFCMHANTGIEESISERKFLSYILVWPFSGHLNAFTSVR